MSADAPLADGMQSLHAASKVACIMNEADILETGLSCSTEIQPGKLMAKFIKFDQQYLQNSILLPRRSQHAFVSCNIYRTEDNKSTRYKNDPVHIANSTAQSSCM